MAFKMKGFKPHNMYRKELAKTEKEHLALEEKGYGHSPYKLKDACYYKAKKAHKVFPSAYASGMIAKCRKKKG